MAAMMFVFAWLGAFILLGTICEKIMPDKAIDKMMHFFKFD